MSTLSKYILGILVIIAIVLGYKIYEKKNPSTASQNAPVTNTNATVNTSGSQSASAALKVDPKTLLNPPAADASDAEKKEYFDKVVANATETNSIEIAGCMSDPVVSTLKKGSDVTFTNKDTGPHTVVFTKDLFYTIPAGSSKVVKAEFGKGAGIYGFGCDKSNKAIGMILLSE